MNLVHVNKFLCKHFHIAFTQFTLSLLKVLSTAMFSTYACTTVYFYDQYFWISCTLLYAIICPALHCYLEYLWIPCTALDCQEHYWWFPCTVLLCCVQSVHRIGGGIAAALQTPRLATDSAMSTVDLGLDTHSSHPSAAVICSKGQEIRDRKRGQRSSSIALSEQCTNALIEQYALTATRLAQQHYRAIFTESIREASNTTSTADDQDALIDEQIFSGAAVIDEWNQFLERAAVHWNPQRSDQIRSDRLTLISISIVAFASHSSEVWCTHRIHSQIVVHYYLFNVCSKNTMTARAGYEFVHPVPTDSKYECIEIRSQQPILDVHVTIIYHHTTLGAFWSKQFIYFRLSRFIYYEMECWYCLS